MKKNQNSYCFIDSKHIRRCEYEIRREFSFNDFDNVYYQKGLQDIDKIFESNNVPEKYRKVILEFKGVNIKGGSTEIFTKTPFLTKKSYATPEGATIKGVTETTDITDWMDFDDTSTLVDYNSVIFFKSKLIDEDLLTSYMKSIYEFFRVKDKIKDKDIQLIKRFHQNNE